MKHLIIGNWKMNPTSQKDAKDLFEAVKKGCQHSASEIVICPPNPYLSLLKDLGLPLGAQNICFEERGPFTGEISALMVKDLGVEYVILGHSERRKYFNETNEIINKKIKSALRTGLKAIFCVGETAAERDSGKKNEILENQIREGLSGIINDGIASVTELLVVAYEPVWAIGTGKNCDVDETKNTVEFIRKILPAGTKVIYGGSVTSQTSGDYVKQAGVDGLLVGGASLNSEEFVKIVSSAE
jgi:triosephosphate isomerase